METQIEYIRQQVEKVKPIQYGRLRNFVDGAVTRLSPYISRGVISTKYVMESVLNRGFQIEEIEKFIQELAWRDYWQNVWCETGDSIHSDFKRKQEPVDHYNMPKAVLEAKTGITAVDQAIEQLYETGYMHNHMRMYVAAICTNMGRAHWKEPAKWMYYHLFDGDWASNALSWQWVAGSNANKKYVANQDNINKYWKSNQKGTFLDVDYERFNDWKVPEVLKEGEQVFFPLNLPSSEEIEINRQKSTLIYNFYNLDPEWHRHSDYNRVLLLEPNFFREYPVSEKVIDFILSLSQNIAGIQLFIGNFEDIKNKCGEVIYKEHPCNAHYEGKEEERDWMFSIKGYFPSFFAFWKRCKKELYA